MKGFRRPRDMRDLSEPKVNVSTRIKVETRRYLEREAKQNKIALSALIGEVIEDYAKWLRSHKED